MRTNRCWSILLCGLFVLISCQKESINDGHWLLKPDASANLLTYAEIQSDGKRACQIIREWTATGTTLQSIEVLFMIDDSQSMANDFSQMLTGMKSFLLALDSAQIHFCTGIMLAYADNPDKSGRFIYAQDPSTRVMCRTEYSIAEILYQMEQSLKYVSIGGTSGEAGLYSLKEAMTARWEENRRLGFFKDDAALAVVFVSDENDISESRDPGGCTAGPYTFYPPGLSVVGNNCEEAEIRKRYYSLSDGYQRWGYHQVFRTVSEIKGPLPIFAASITHQPGDELDEEEEYGYGYNEFTDLAYRGQRINLDLVRSQRPDSLISAFTQFADIIQQDGFNFNQIGLGKTPLPGSARLYLDGEHIDPSHYRISGQQLLISSKFAADVGQWTLIYTPAEGCNEDKDQSPTLQQIRPKKKPVDP